MYVSDCPSVDFHVFTVIKYIFSGFNPVFDETFEFHINLPELALVRFVVLDDDFIGDAFIGQYTIPFVCMQQGEAVTETCKTTKGNFVGSVFWRLSRFSTYSERVVMKSDKKMSHGY